jgi:hypothetical protein
MTFRPGLLFIAAGILITLWVIRRQAHRTMQRHRPAASRQRLPHHLRKGRTYTDADAAALLSLDDGASDAGSSHTAPTAAGHSPPRHPEDRDTRAKECGSDSDQQPEGRDDGANQCSSDNDSDSGGGGD